MQLRNTLIGAAAIAVVLAVVVLAIAVKRAPDPARSGQREGSASPAEVGAAATAEVAPASMADRRPSAAELLRGSAGGSMAAMAGGPAPSGSDAQPRSARQRRVDMVAAIAGSGSAAEAWSEQGASVLEALGAHAVATTETGCFVAGCAAVVTFSSAAEYERRRGELEATSAFATWTGSKRWSEPEVIAGGQVIVALVLDRPD